MHCNLKLPLHSLDFMSVSHRRPINMTRKDSSKIIFDVRFIALPCVPRILDDLFIISPIFQKCNVESRAEFHDNVTIYITDILYKYFTVTQSSNWTWIGQVYVKTFAQT